MQFWNDTQALLAMCESTVLILIFQTNRQTPDYLTLEDWTW